MKKVISLLLLLAMCLSLFAGCKKEEATGEDYTSDLESAVAYLKQTYQTAGKDELMEISTKMEVFSKVTIGGQGYPVTWTVQVTQGEPDAAQVLTEGEKTFLTVNKSAVEVLFTATATVTAENGQTKSISFGYKIPAAYIPGDDASMEELVDQAYELESGASMDKPATLTGVITMIKTPWDEGYQNITVVIRIGELTDKPITCYRLTGEGADGLAMGDTITVTGTLTNYNGSIQFAQGCVVEDIVKNEEPAPEAPEDPKQIVAEAYALASGASLPYEATLTGVITKVNTPYNSGYGNVSVTIQIEGCEDQPILCYRIKGEGADVIKVSDTITVTGYIINYNGTIEFNQGSTLDSYVPGTEPVPEAPTDPKQILADAYALADGDSLAYKATLTGVIISVDTPFDPNYNNVTVTIAVAGCEDQPIQCYRVAGEGADSIAVGDLITVTGYILNYHGAVQFNQGSTLDNVVKGETPADPTDPSEPEVTDPTPGVTAPDPSEPAPTQPTEPADSTDPTTRPTQPTEPVEIPTTVEGILEAAAELAEGEELPYTVILTGKVTKVNEAYSEDYKNITVTMAVVDHEDTLIKCYRLRVQDNGVPEVGDTITVNGTLKNYYGDLEFVDCDLEGLEEGEDAPDSPQAIVDAAYGLATGEALEYEATLTGKITKIKTAYSTQYKNITVIIAVEGREDKPIECFRLKGDGAENLVVGDTITVTGVLKNYNGTIEFDAGCVVSNIVSGGVTVPSNPKQIVDAAFALAQGESLPYSATLTGTVKSIDTPYDSGYKNITITIEVEGSNGMKDLVCYRLKGDGAASIAVGDTVTVSGIIVNYNGTIEFNSGCELV